MAIEVDCRSLSLQLARFGDLEHEGVHSILTGPAGAHVSRCLRCQAEVAAYRKLRRAMVSLGPAPIGIDGRWVDELLAGFRAPAPVHRLRSPGRRRALFGGVAAAVTAAGAGAVVVATRLAGRVSLAG